MQDAACKHLVCTLRPEVLASNKACRELLLSKLYQKNAVSEWLTRITVMSVMLIGKFIISQM